MNTIRFAIVLEVGFMLRFTLLMAYLLRSMPAYRRVKELVNEGVIEKPADRDVGKPAGGGVHGHRRVQVVRDEAGCTPRWPSLGFVRLGGGHEPSS
jgi:hypothetical protein